MLAVSAMLTSSSAYVPASAVAPTRPTHTVRQRAVFMDETIMEKALAGELEQEGAENVFMSELGWATYLDKNAGSSYNMNERPSMAQDGYFTADIFSNPIDGAAAGSRDGRGGHLSWGVLRGVCALERLGGFVCVFTCRRGRGRGEEVGSWGCGGHLGVVGARGGRELRARGLPFPGTRAMRTGPAPTRACAGVAGTQEC